MKFYVIGADRQRYGPEEMPTLLRWTRERRIVADTVLIDAASGREYQAADIPGLAAAIRGTPTPGPEAVRVEPRAFDANQRRANDYAAAPYAAVPNPRYAEAAGTKSKVSAALLALLFPGFGLHRFYLGFPGIAILQILLTPVCGIGAIWCIVEGVLCLLGRMHDSDGRPLRD
ncbi:MAG: TM2 domain-containing protein [Phycisphaerae bacterium]|nr:TM2 domain-containing protein [Phycisphaerae bacterium]